MNDKACDLCGENKGHRGPGLCHCCNLQARNRTLEVELEKCREALEEAVEDMASMADNICHYVEYGCLPTAEEVAQACSSTKQARQALERMGQAADGEKGD